MSNIIEKFSNDLLVTVNKYKEKIDLEEKIRQEREKQKKNKNSPENISEKMLETILYEDNYNAPLKIRISKTLNSIREDIEKASNKSKFSDYIRWYFKKNDINLEIGEILVTKVKKSIS